MKLNTHGLKMNGIKRAAGDTLNWGPWGGFYNEIAYDRETGNIWVKHMSANWWSEYHDPAVLTFSTSRKMSMQEIADAIANAIKKHEA